MQNSSFLIQNSSFLIQNSSFLLTPSCRPTHLPPKFGIENDEFCIEKGEFRTENDEFCITKKDSTPAHLQKKT